MEHREFWRLIKALQMPTSGWSLLQTGGFGTDLTLSTQSSLSVLLFDALCPQISQCAPCRALGHAVPLFLSCYFGVALRGCNSIFHYSGHFLTEKSQLIIELGCHVESPKGLNQPLFSGSKVSPLLRTVAQSRDGQLEVRLSLWYNPQSSVCLHKLLVDKGEMEEFP